MDVLQTLFVASVLILYLIEHNKVWDSVVCGRPFEMLCNRCSIVEKQEPEVSALASGSREENDLYYCIEAIGALQTVGDFPRRNKAESPTIGDRLTCSVCI